MPFRWGQPGLIDYLGDERLIKLIKTRLFGTPYLGYYDYCSLLGFVYESGAVLGRARHDKSDILGKMLEAPWKEPAFMQFCQDQAKERLDTFRSEARREPRSFPEFILIEEFVKAIEDRELRREMRGAMTERQGTLLQKGGTGERETGWLKEVSIPASEKRGIAKALQKKIELPTVEEKMRVFGQEGIGFGISFPELTEKMYKNFHENSAILDKSAIINLEQREEDVLQIVAIYAFEYYQELLDPLDLRGHLHVEGVG